MAETGTRNRFRLYASDELGKDGYPPEWVGEGRLADGIKDVVRHEAGHRCVRCLHPYRSGEHGNGEWSPCDERCVHGMPARDLNHSFESLGLHTTTGMLVREGREQGVERRLEAQWRILTVHHLDGDKANCRWWNLAALCQRCHLSIQGKVQMARVWPWEHSPWFRPYVAGYYAWTYLGEDLDRDETALRIDELLALERVSHG